MSKVGLLFAISALSAGCASAAAERSYPATHPASAQAPAAPFVRPVNVLAGEIPFPNLAQQPAAPMGMNHGSMPGMDHSGMSDTDMDHGGTSQGSMDHSAMGHGATGESRTNHAGMDHAGMDHSAMQSSRTTSPESAGTRIAQAEPAKPTATGKVNAVNAEQRTVNISHQPIPALGWPAMTMDMAVAPSVDLQSVKPGSTVTFTLTRGADGVYMIDSLRLASGGGAMPGMDHGQMGHGSMPGMKPQ